MRIYRKGVTLLELLMVMLLIGVMTLLAVPLLANFGSSTRLGSASKNIAINLRLARTLAIAQNIRHAAVIYSRTASEGELQNRIFIVKKQNGIDTIVEKPWTAPSLIEIPDISGNSNFKRIEFTGRGTTGSSRSIHVIQKGTKINGNPYSPSGSYGSSAKAFYKERYKCHTITITGSGRIRIFSYGKNTPWAGNEI